MPNQVTHRIDNAQLYALLNSHDGGVVKDLMRRGFNVQSQAKRELENSPRRVDTGTLRSSIHVQAATVSGHFAVLVLTNVRYAVFVHDGTGIYGPRHQVIRPVKARALRWRDRQTGRVVRARWVRGMRPNPFLRKALVAARDH